jgi:hypothetical protein
MELVETGPTSSVKDALAAIVNLVADRESVGRWVEGGVVQMAVGLMDRFPEKETVFVPETMVNLGCRLCFLGSQWMGGEHRVTFFLFFQFPRNQTRNRKIRERINI